MEEKIELLRSNTNNDHSAEEINKLSTKIDECSAKLYAQNENHESKFNMLKEKFNNYMLVNDYSEFKAQLTKSIEDIIAQISIRYAEKATVKKLINNLEAEVKKLSDMMDECTEHNENAMLSKKPLGGISCASCEKNLINLQGLKSQFLVWGKFPKREDKPLNKSGFGFSKILSMLKPDDLEKSATVREMMNEKEADSPTSEGKKPRLKPISSVQHKTSKLLSTRKSNC